MVMFYDETMVRSLQEYFTIKHSMQKALGPLIVNLFHLFFTTGGRLYLYEPRPPIFDTKFDKIYYIRLCECFFNSSLPLSDEQT